jgi:hypothetical protein
MAIRSPRSLSCRPLVRLFLLAASVASATLTPARTLDVLPSDPGQPPRLTSDALAGTLLRLEASDDLSSWTEAARLHDAVHAFPAPGFTGSTRRYYRLSSGPRGPLDDWKNQLLFPDDPFQAEAHYDTPRWVKFALVLSEPERVYFQDSRKHPFHYEFATQRLAPFLGMSRPAFDAVSLRRAGRQIVLGTVLFPPRSNFVEFGIQFVGLDPYTPDEITRWFRAVQAAVHAETGAAALYLPAFEQLPAAREHAPTLAARGITVASIDRWVRSSHVYSDGWALGTLKFFPAAEIDAAFTDGRLKSEDILLTDGVPAETPLVAGIISLLPSTPNSHTAILAQSFDIPFVHLPDPADQERVQALAGRTVVLRAVVTYDQGTVTVIDAHDSLPAPLAAELLALKVPAPINFAPKQSFGALSAPTDALAPSDIKWFGGKAANYGVLRRTIPANCPPAVALSFDLWDAYLDQPLPGGGTLRAEISSRLAPHQTYPPQIAPLRTALAGIRDLITAGADFTPAQREAIVSALAGFTPGRKIRFRSSTNVEDAESFTGAGLYDSYSGCLLDDTDGDSTGPSACDPAEAQERGVFRAIRRVYASFYNDYAYLERLRHGVDESKVGMAVLVHHSFPDEEELANGVATLDFRYSFGSTADGKLVTQLGAESVTNPDGTALPEVVEVFSYNDSVDLTLRQHSSRVPIGAAVMEWQADYRGLLALLRTVGQGWRQLDPQKSRFLLDFEYKKDVNLGLVVKQVRPIPLPAEGVPVTAFLLDDPVDWVVAQKEAADVFANHRLKSLWRLHARPMRTTRENLANGVIIKGRQERVETDALAVLDGRVSTWPESTTSIDGTRLRWATGLGAARRQWELQVPLVPTVAAAAPPVITINDFDPMVTVTYTTPMPIVDYDGTFKTTTTDIVFLEPRRAVTPGASLVQRSLANGRGTSVHTSFYWPDTPPLAAGYTAPLVRFDQTTLTGLTTDPMVLRGYYSQTYRPGHHNFTEEFIFEPRLEPGVPEAALAELAAADILYIHVHAGFEEPVFHAVGFDGKLRRL